MITIIIILAVGFLTGITTILFGFGGGFVVVPLVYHVVCASKEYHPYAMHIAVATSTAVMIFNASYATWTHYRNRNFTRDIIIPMIFFIAIGAVIGALASTLISSNWLRMLFMLYLLGTIIDCLLRRGFLTKSEPATLSNTTLSLGGLVIGFIAAFLGLGGSMLTVPLMRRHGHSMRQCVAAASPLAVPTAIAGTLTYIILGWHKTSGSAYFGYVNLGFTALLIIAGMAGIIFAKDLLPKISDTLHVKIYIALLIVMLVAMFYKGQHPH